ncbi:ABC transporter permease [Agromyces sp. ZXT2-6]|uniref:ABC transporter permease n=1 Tax=Agromyces sp. ZXT2-6 TaxID=3461153 RepID=UPI004054EF7E
MTITTTDVESPTSETGPAIARNHRVLSFFARYGTLLVLAGMIIAFGLASPNAFLTERNLVNVLNQSALLAIVAGGLTLVLVAGQFDLSFGNVLGLTGILAVGLMERSGLPIPVAIGLALVAAAVVGLANGLLVSGLRVNPIVATLATSTIVLGINFWYSNGAPINLSGGSFTAIARGNIFGVPMPIIIELVFLAILWVVLNRTVFGHHAQAVGANPVAARLAGVNVARVTLIAFVIGAVAAGIAGIVLSARIGSAQVTAGDSFLLGAFAACFLGASVLRDGEFHILGTFIGVLIVTVATNGFAILGAPSYAQYIVQGVILAGAVALSTTSRRILGQVKR